MTSVSMLSFATRFSVVILLINFSQSYNIAILPVTGKSHVFSLTVIAQELVLRGHNVTMVLPDYFPAGKELESNQSGINLERILPAEGEVVVDYDKLGENITAMILDGKPDMKKMFKELNILMKADCYRLLIQNEKLFDKLKASQFDLVVVEGVFASKCAYLVPHRLGVPFVSYTDLINPVLVGVPWLPSFVPHQMSTYTDKMTFQERLQNTAVSLFWTFAQLFPDPEENVLNKYREYGAFSNLDELSEKSLLWLTQRDVVLDYAKPAMPNIISIGGLTAKPANGKLTKELDRFMSKAKKGVILVTFGSQVEYLKEHIASKFLTAFGSLEDYKIIWRFDNKDKLVIPDNVLIAKWLPQNDLLADSRVKLFITHSGNNGQQEAIYHGVPMIGFPLFGDQPYNAARLRARGYGLAMTMNDFTAEQLLTNILQIVNDPTYKQRTTLASKIFKSALQTPAERASYWIEHVIQFGGDHLRSAGSDLNVFQYYMLDILAFVLLLAVIVVAVVVIGIRCLVRCCGKKSGDSKKKKVPTATLR